ncbi:hypothetical protein OPV22_012036 [Ensete ventricosum]|uniref:60S ribosomal protein L41 n=1 Tax=Ensete ventricosum TaxID=4639 RepID=A0AAV8R586_ENSVE|nr:hypothetical protein OPV22_012036 [Ensete ventricosum]
MGPDKPSFASHGDRGGEGAREAEGSAAVMRAKWKKKRMRRLKRKRRKMRQRSNCPHDDGGVYQWRMLTLFLATLGLVVSISGADHNHAC